MIHWYVVHDTLVISVYLPGTRYSSSNGNFKMPSFSWYRCTWCCTALSSLSVRKQVRINGNVIVLLIIVVLNYCRRSKQFEWRKNGMKALTC